MFTTKKMDKTLKGESAKLRPLRSHVQTCFPCLSALVPACLRANVPYVFTCSRANVPCVLTCSRANVSWVLTCSCTSVPCVRLVPTCLHAHVL